MSISIEWTDADVLTPSPFTVVRDGCHYEVKMDAHYVSDEELQTLRRYIATLNDENDRLRKLVNVMAFCMQQGRDCDGCAVNGADGVVTAPSGCDTLRDRMRELGVSGHDGRP